MTYTSPSTISRFCRKIGEKNYNEFRVHLLSSVLEDNELKINHNRPFLVDDNSEQIVDKIGVLYDETIKVTKSFLDIKNLDKIVDLLSKAKNIDVYGIGSFCLSALNFEQKMMFTPYTVHFEKVFGNQVKQAALSDKDTATIIISYTGEEDEIKKIINYIKENKGVIIAVTSIDDSYLRECADYCLTMCSKENNVSKIASYSSKVSADYLMDVLFSKLFQINYNINLIEKLSRERKFLRKDIETK